MFNVIIYVSFAVFVVSIALNYFYSATCVIEDMANNGLLLVGRASSIHSLCLQACNFAKNRLYIKVNDTSKNILPLLSQQIVNVYSKSIKECGDLDIRLILNTEEPTNPIKTSCPIDVMIYDKDVLHKGSDMKKYVDTSNDCTNITLNNTDSTINPETSVNDTDFKTYEYVVLGGTFDRLHNGHKILLSEAALRATKHVTVGVTDVNMIKSKKLWELIEPVEDRVKSVLDFLNDIKPNLEYDVVPIQDLYGPTKDDPRFQMIVVSEETVRGADKINEKRQDLGLSPLERHVIKLAEDKMPQKSREEEEKVSSSNKRMRLLGTVLRTPQPNPNIPSRPYVIGLAGGIASGKSSITEKLKAKGAGIVNCDLIAHELYKPGLPLNATIADAFGDNVITQDGEVDRKALGQIVFGDKSKLEQLNRLVWPAVIEEAQNRIKALGELGHEVVVMEAAVMVRAKWYNTCHQLWMVIIPPEEAIQRIMKRNNLTEVEARQRIESQPPNSEQVALANVVFSPYWSYEYTQKQVDKAWEELQSYLDIKN